MRRFANAEKPRTPQGWRWPANLMPAGVQGWPAGRRPQSEAEEILSEAVGWWDAGLSGYRKGDRLLRNIGTAGGFLDLALGGNRSVATSNDPLFLAPEDQGYLWQPSGSGNQTSVPHSAGVEVTGDVDLAIHLQADSWSGYAANTYFLRKGSNSATDSYALQINTANFLRFAYGDGAARLAASTESTTTLTPGKAYWLRGTRRASDGKVRFYTSTDPATTPWASISWTQFGTDVTITGSGTATGNTTVVNMGIIGASQTDAAFRRCIVRNGFDGAGSTVLDVDTSVITSAAATSFTATTGQTVTIGRATSGRKVVAVPGRRYGTRPVFLFGTDDFLECVDGWQHNLLNFGQQDSFTVLAALRQWPNAGNARYIVSKIPGQATVGSPGWALSTGTTPAGSSVAATLTDTPSVTSDAYSYGVTNVVVSQKTRGDINGIAVNGVLTTSPFTNKTSPRDFSNSSPLRICGSAATANLTDMEFYAAAIWRRVLTPREISVLSTYYTTGG